jgi:Spy/CpxP family protein refolding chaperone
MRRIWFLVIAVSVGLNAGLLIKSMGPGLEGPGREPAPGHLPGEGHFESVVENHLRRMTESLELDDEQRSTIAAIHVRLMPRIAAERRAMGEMRRTIASLFASPEFNPEAFQALARELSEAQARLDSLVTEAMLGEAAVLSPEQRQKYVGEMPWGKPPMPPMPRGHRREEEGDGR